MITEDLPVAPTGVGVGSTLDCISSVTPPFRMLRDGIPVFNLLGHGEESLLDIGGVLG